MTIVVPSDPGSLSFAEIVRGADVGANDWREVAQLNHHLYGVRHGQRGTVPLAGGVEVTSSSFVTIGWAYPRWSRPMGGLNADILMSFFARENTAQSGTLEVQITRINLDGSTASIATVSGSFNSILQQSVSFTEVLDGGVPGNGRVATELEFRAKTDDSIVVDCIEYRAEVTTDPSDF